MHATTGGNVGNIRSQESTLAHPNFTILSPLGALKNIREKGCTDWVYHGLPRYMLSQTALIASWAALPLATPVWHTHRHCSSRLS